MQTYLENREHLQSNERSPRGTDRLFVPLASEPYQWFHSGQKKWELRRRGRQYTLANVRPGREVELRRGYSDRNSALWGEIVDVHEAGNLSLFFAVVCWKDVLPASASLENAIAEAGRILNIEDIDSTPVLGFRIKLSGRDETVKAQT